jgi:hypothetical protein
VRRAISWGGGSDVVMIDGEAGVAAESRVRERRTRNKVKPCQGKKSDPNCTDRATG